MNYSRSMDHSQSATGISKRKLLKFASFFIVFLQVFQFNINNPYSLRSHNEIYCGNPKIAKYGTVKIMSCLASKIWSLVPEIIKSSKTLNKIGKWKPDCPCRLM